MAKKLLTEEKLVVPEDAIYCDGFLQAGRGYYKPASPESAIKYLAFMHVAERANGKKPEINPFYPSGYSVGEFIDSASISTLNGAVAIDLDLGPADKPLEPPFVGEYSATLKCQIVEGKFDVFFLIRDKLEKASVQDLANILHRVLGVSE